MPHTPGPWKLASTYPDIDGYKVIGGTLAFRKGPRLLAVVKNQGQRPLSEDSSADALLIAAAPDLLQALKDALHLLEMDGSRHNIWHRAIDKAEGRE